ncbi:non-ribosomal peptide synthetase [Aliterella atlantica]|uniref:non-ribosomal peptide synthetase n=1 Tax=Aliterella atlantica TaxID=1827278 RepID=UPI0005D305F2|nr:non-ribosomal peptide synthetase [Aliterella atlantica]
MANNEFVFPASFAQQRLWFLCQLAPNNPFYNVSAAIRLNGYLNINALEQTFNEIVRRHEVLRTTFEMVEGQLNQVVAEEASLTFKFIDLRYQAAKEQDTEVRQKAIALSQRPFDLAADLLLRVTLFQLNATEHILLLSLHHIIADGWSIGVLISEISTLYTTFDAGKDSPLPDLPIQYADFAYWQREHLQGEVLESQLAYWRSQLANLPTLNLPSDRPRPAIPSYKGATQPLELSNSLSTSLELLSQEVGATLFMTLLAAFQILMSRYTGQTDIVVGSPIANRHRAEIEPLIGFFVNNLVLRTDLAGNPTFKEVLLRVKAATLGAYAHQDLPFEKLVELQPRDLSRHPLFQVAIAFANTPITALDLPNLTLSQFEFDEGTSKLDLELHFWNLAGIKGKAIYNTDLFDRDTICRIIGHFQTLLSEIVANPDKKIADLNILPAAERQQLLNQWNNIAIGNRCIHELFIEQANKTPDAIAISYENEQITYQELDKRSNQLAHYLQKLGVAPEIIVGICLKRSPNAIIAILGILKAGGAYLPLDPAYPPERLQSTIEDAQVSILLTQQSSIQPNCRQIYIDDWSAIAQASQQAVISNVSNKNLAYVIYTSGSTGKPKGVLVEHGGLSNLAQAQMQTFNLKSESRILQFASLSFDASIFEIIMALTVGATLYIVSESARLGTALLDYIQQHSITHATLPPAVLKNLTPRELPTLQTLIVAGEACTAEIVANWAKGRRFFNAYGLTETTVWSTVAEIKDRISIGCAIANTQIYILDEHLQPVPIGIPGEIYIGGIGVARGYLHQPELTAEKFIPNPHVESFIQNPQFHRLYKTGDIARYLPDGNIEFIGRHDNQVKIRGYRIELGEVENLLSQHPAIKTAAVTNTDKQLTACIVFQPNLTATTVQLQQFLQQKLPNYAIPSAYVVLPTLPLTNSSKIDRNALKALNIDKLEHSYIAPRTPTETTITKIWEQILKLEQVGVEDNFFALGGDSLLAVNLLEQINRQFEQNIPLSALFSSPTIAQFAPLIENNYTEHWSPVVPLQPKGANLPFFCVHPIFGVVLPYYELACQLGTQQPFYGLQALGLDGGHQPLTSIEEMAACYIKAMRQVQAQGPYQIGGWSFGGLLAFEMAQQLQQLGEKVSLLAIIDTRSPISANQPSFWAGWSFLVTTATRSIYPFLLDYWSIISDRFPKSLKRKTISSLLPQETKLRMLDELTVHRLLQVFAANSRATLKYVPQKYSGAIALFTSNSFKDKHDPTLGWSQIAASGVEVHNIPGNHLSMLKQPHIQVLAEKLYQYLAKNSNL